MAARPADFTDPLQAILRVLEDEQVPHVLIGGLAVSQLSRPRFTADIDLLTYLHDDAAIPRLMERAALSGFAPRIEEAEGFARRNRVLLLVHRPTDIEVDISLGLLPFEREVLDNRRLVPAGELLLPLPRVEDLIIMKAVAHRPVDLQDIRGLVEAHPTLDRDRVRKVISEFADALELPEILDDFLALLGDSPQ